MSQFGNFGSFGNQNGSQSDTFWDELESLDLTGGPPSHAFTSEMMLDDTSLIGSGGSNPFFPSSPSPFSGWPPSSPSFPGFDQPSSSNFPGFDQSHSSAFSQPEPQPTSPFGSSQQSSAFSAFDTSDPSPFMGYGQQSPSSFLFEAIDTGFQDTRSQSTGGWQTGPMSSWDAFNDAFDDNFSDALQDPQYDPFTSSPQFSPLSGSPIGSQSLSLSPSPSGFDISSPSTSPFTNPFSSAFTSTQTSTLPKISVNRNRTYAIDNLTEQDEPVRGGGTRWHQFSTRSFVSEQQVDTYMAQTGLDQDTGVTQDWGGGSGKLYRSRRGSIGGFSTNLDGTVSGFRWSSYATSQALNKGDPSSFVADYEQAAQQVHTPAVNTKGNPQSINAVASDVGKVRLQNGDFSLTATTYASGFSGKGITNESSTEVETIYAPTIQTSLTKGNTGSPAETYHSEGMAVTLHEHLRGGPLRQESNVIGMVTSVPNQVCRNCHDMFVDNMGPNSLASGMPGTEFKGQKPGLTIGSIPNPNAVSKAVPTDELIGNSGNRSEVGNIGAWHL